MSRHEMESSIPEVLGSVTESINIYYDHVLPPHQEQIKIVTTHKEEDGQFVIEYFYLQRFFDTIYYIKCDRSYLVDLFGKKAVNSPIETVTFNLLQEEGSNEAVFVTHTDAQTNISHCDSIDLCDLDETDQEAAEVLERLELGLLTVLVRHGKKRNLFDGLPQQVKDLLVWTYGRETADKIWKTEVAKGD